MSEENTQEIIDVPEESTAVARQSATIQDVDFFDRYSPERVLEHFKNKAKVMLGIREHAIQLTKNDWIDQKGTPYLEAAGVERLIATFNIEFGITDQKKIHTSDSEGNYYLWQAKVWGNGFSVRVEGLGVASQRDKFFSMKNKVRKESNQINEAHILQKAITNGKNKVITSLFGLKGLTWDELKKHGVSPHTTINYDGKGATKRNRQQGPPMQPEKMADPKDVEKFKRTAYDNIGDEAKAEKWLNDAGKSLASDLDIKSFDELTKYYDRLLNDLIMKFEEEFMK